MSIKYVFSINSGRSGSDYLTELLLCATNSISKHEEFPIMNGDPMVLFNDGDDTELRNLMQLKIKEIKKSIGKTDKIYCETNHSYIKGWGYILPDEFIPQEEIAVIILRRNIKDIAYSLLRVHEIPGLTQHSRTWYLSVKSKRNLSTPKKDAEPLDICLWYINEIMLRAEKYKKEFPKITYIDCNLEELNNYDYVLKIFQRLGLVPTEKLMQICGKPLNKRNEWPRLPIDELLSRSKYQSADSLKHSDREKLIENYLLYIQEKHFGLICSMKPDYAMGGTLAPAATTVISKVENELEEVFQYSLKFTETEEYLILELLRLFSPNDLYFFFAERQDNLSYKFDYNIKPSLINIIKKLGIKVLLNVLKVAMRGMWGRDYSHRLKES
jgi:hypothetical protein